jgi:hypothetical protein
LVTVAGCGSGSGGGSVPFSQFEPSAVQAVCHLLVLCGDFPDQATCVASEQTQPHYYETLGPDISSGKVIYDGTKAKTCLDAINAVSSCNRSTEANVVLSSACDGIFTGTVATGGGCFFGTECAGGSCNATAACAPNQCCAGTCSASTMVGLGGDCGVSGAICVSGTTCTFDTSTRTDTCQQLPGQGAPCGYPNYASTCASPFYCDSVSGTCKAPVATGGPCDPTLGPEGCDSVLDSCDPTTSVCTHLLPVGSTCGSPSVGCISYAVCDPTTLTCVERPGVGAACDPSYATGALCLGGATCDPTTTTCTLQPTAGACS